MYVYVCWHVTVIITERGYGFEKWVPRGSYREEEGMM